MEQPLVETISQSLVSFQSFTTGSVLELVVMGLLLFFSAAVSGSEVAYFSLSPTDIDELQQDDAKGAKRTLKLLKRPKTLLATILIANNFINIAIVVLSTLIINSLFSFHSVLLGFVVQIVAVTFLILLIGEVIPKVYATSKPQELSKQMSVTISGLVVLFSPISKFLIRFSNFFERKLGKKGANISADELEHAIELTYQEGEAREDEQKILKEIVKFGNTEVRQIMTARVDAVALEESTAYTSVQSLILECGYSRIPVYRESFDSVTGVLYIKDLLEHIGNDDVDWLKLIRQPYYVPENKKIVDLVKEFQERKNHLAIVVDEYGGTQGIITLEDIIEEIVGEISDEFDVEDLVYSKIDDLNYIFEAKTPLVDLYKILEITGEAFENARGETGSIAGFLLEQMGRIPQKNERYVFQGYTFTVEAADKRKVKRVKITIPNA